MNEKTCGKYCREHLYYALRFARKHDIGDDEHNKECVALRLDDSDTDKIITALEQHESLSKQASQRGARLQIMRDWMKKHSVIMNEFGDEQSAWSAFADYHDADSWFDEDGVPVRE